MLEQGQSNGRKTIADILLPETPESIAAAYGRLAERAKVEDFGLLEEDVVVLDTETTGLSFADCQLTEIAAARLRGREVVDLPHLRKPRHADTKEYRGADAHYGC